MKSYPKKNHMHRIGDQIDPNEEEYDMGQLNQLNIILLEAWTMS